MSRSFTLVSGTGRSGTSVLMLLLDALGFDTQFPFQFWNEKINAGYEYSVLDANKEAMEVAHWIDHAPTIIKDPRFCYTLDRLLDYKFTVELLLIPVRDQNDCARSRSQNDIEWVGDSLTQKDWIEMGGRPEEALDQITFNQKCLSSLITTATLNEIPFLTLAYPRFVRDPVYLFKKLEDTHLNSNWSDFMKAFKSVVDHQKIHNYNVTK